MKMVKKVLMGLSIFALVLSLAGCDGLFGNKVTNGLNGEADEEDQAVEGTVNGSMITGQASNAKIDVNNNEDKIKREVDLLLTKHLGSRAKIIQENINVAKANGMMGYAFNVVEHEDETTKEKSYDLCIVGATYYKGVPVTYLSAFRNVKDLSASNLGAYKPGDTGYTGTKNHIYTKTNDPDATKFKADTEPCEYEIIALPVNNGTATKNLDYYAYDEEAKTFTVCINVVAESDGSYTVEWYKPADVLNDSGNWKLASVLKNVSDKKTEKVPAAVTGYTAATQAYLGVYANVYGSQSLKGSWRLSGIKGEAQVAEFED